MSDICVAIKFLILEYFSLLRYKIFMHFDDHYESATYFIDRI